MKKKRSGPSPLIIFSLVCFLMVLGLLTYVFITLNAELNKNQEETGLRIYEPERKCYDFCYPDKYYYANEQCICK